jgi:hypothetical protein
MTELSLFQRVRTKWRLVTRLLGLGRIGLALNEEGIEKYRVR